MPRVARNTRKPVPVLTEALEAKLKREDEMMEIHRIAEAHRIECDKLRQEAELEEQRLLEETKRQAEEEEKERLYQQMKDWIKSFCLRIENTVEDGFDYSKVYNFGDDGQTFNFTIKRRKVWDYLDFTELLNKKLAEMCHCWEKECDKRILYEFNMDEDWYESATTEYNISINCMADETLHNGVGYYMGGGTSNEYNTELDPEGVFN